jgi:hypothetical protein
MVKRFYKKVVAASALFTVELLIVWGIFLICVVAFLYISSEVMGGDKLL